MGLVNAIDRFFDRHPRFSIPWAVLVKFFDDQGNYLAATMTYYTFIAIFPLMLLGTSILGFVLEGQPRWQEDILNSALAQFPIIGDQLGRPEGLQGSTGALVFGSLAALYGALGLGQTIQHTLNAAWAVPRNSRPNPFLSRLNSLLVLMTAGLALLVVSTVSSVLSNSELLGERGNWIKDLVPFATILVVTGMLTVLFRLGSARNHAFTRALPGALLVAIAWQGLQLVGAQYVEHVLVGTSSMNKTFGLVLGLIGFIYIAAVIAVIGIELNIVLARTLYPRSLLATFTDFISLTAADKRAYTSYAKMQRHKGFESIIVTFTDSPKDIADRKRADPGPDFTPQEPM